MDHETTRRAVLGALVAGGTGALAVSPADDLLGRFAPFAGQAWSGAERVPDTVESPYGPATVTYDDRHVPHIEADTEQAAYFAVGYAQAADRLFEMDLVRRRMRGTLAAVAGEQVVDSDVFNTRMDFLGAAEASAEAIAGTDTERTTEAFADGVNAYVDEGPLPLEFGLLGYRPREWSVVASLLVGVQISWGLTGSFGTLRQAVLRERLDADTYRRRYPAQFDHGYPILRPGRVGGAVSGVAGRADASADARVGDAVDAGFADWLGRFEPPPYLGSNSWLVAGEHTASGQPIVANDMHLSLMAPPVWYEQRVSAGDVDVRGVAFPGIPFVVAGENDHGAWGFTNTGADVMDLYTYETDDARERYRYDGEFREFDTETRTVEVAGAEDREVTVKKTVHGAFLDREVDGESRHVGVAWTGLSGTRESQAVHELSRSTGREDVLETLDLFDAPTQSIVYADREGHTLYWTTGKIPIRRVEGDVVRGDRVFDGSAGEAEWAGFEPYGQSAWDGFVPFEDKPGVIQPSHIGTANQRPVDDPVYPIGQEYASGFRGTRVYEALDAAVGSGTPVDREFMQELQRDTVDVRARRLVPAVLAAREVTETPEAADPYLDALADWDYRLDRDSTAALFFTFLYEAFREATWREAYEDLGLDSSYWPQEWVLTTLPPDAEAFDGDRATVLSDAVTAAVDRLEAADWETYGDYNQTAIDHPFGGQVGALNYPRYPTDGGAFTVMNFRKEGGAGSSQRTVYPMDGETVTVLPGGNDGSYFSEHYDDQLRLWADGEYRPAPRAVDGDPDITVEGTNGEGGG